MILLPIRFRCSSLFRVGLVTLGVTIPAHAQTLPAAVALDPVEAVGQSILQELTVTSYGDKVAMVTREQLEALHSNDLADALRTVPGLTISRFNPVGSFGGGDGGAVYIRGHGNGRPGSQISIMQDGVARFTAVWTHPLLDLLSIDNVHQVEVLKSPQPVLHGNMAFGAINLKAKLPTTPGSRTRLKAGGGSYGSYEAIWENSYGHGGFRSHVVASRRESKGHRANSAGHLSNLSAHLAHAWNERWKITAFINATDSAAEDPQAVNSPPRPVVETYQTEGLFGTLSLQHAIEAREGFVKLYWDSGESQWHQWDGAPPPPIGAAFTNITDFEHYGLQWQENLQLHDWKLTGGYDLQVYGGESTDDYEGRAADFIFPSALIRQHSVYLLVRHEGIHRENGFRLRPSAGVRYNQSDPFDNQWSAQVGVVAERDDTQFYAQYSRAYNYAGIYAAVFNQRWGFLGLGPTNWHNLQPETLDHFEIGVQHLLVPGLKVDFSVYHDRSDNALRFDPPPPPVGLDLVDSYLHRGAEITLLMEPARQVRLFVGLTHNDVTPVNRPNLPDTTATLGGHWQFARGWRLNADAQYVADQFVQGPRFADPPEPIEAYVLSNVKLTRDYAWGDGAVRGQVYLAVRNLLDESFEFQPGYRAPGINWMLGFDAEF